MVFTESDIYRSLHHKKEDFKNMFSRLYNCILDRSRYHNDSISRNGEERDSTEKIFWYLRNAISHHRIGIVPISETVNGNRQITDIAFKDNHRRFELKSSVYDLEDVIIEM